MRKIADPACCFRDGSIQVIEDVYKMTELGEQAAAIKFFLTAPGAFGIISIATVPDLYWPLFPG
jgi:hypothetical protein